MTRRERYVRQTIGNVLIILVTVVSVVAIIGSVLLRSERRAPATNFITETDPEWVPRLPGSSNTPIVMGQCGQWDGRYWHRVECPRVDR